MVETKVHIGRSWGEQFGINTNELGYTNDGHSFLDFVF